ncbi:hypothetical protein ZYGR_0W00540 [Zygosaccharomyces rouxii]|uniref:Amino acid permease/ SLC12A domain-containing protein n=1 Tax=Zygosaccharomyces rouxii TaxID=4956 RepID=A0A1Q3A4E1_ZYGRO|nr:hypothetical protein ZYGR_0W00540 [Zygosaccharomyces rouxii]
MRPEDTITPYELQDVKGEAVSASRSPPDNEVEYFDKLGDARQYTSNLEGEGTPTEGVSRHRIKNPLFRNFIDSFKRGETTARIADLENDLTTAVSPQLSNYHGSIPSDEVVIEKEELKRDINQRHMVFMAIGSGVGTGLLVGNASTLNSAGPAGLLIGYALMGTCVYCVIQAAGELGVTYANLIGGFNAYPAILVAPSFAFSVGWIYTLQWLCMTPLELVTASLTIKYWTTKVDPDVFVVIFYLLILLINFFGSKGYAEADFFFNCMKLAMISGFFILGIVVACGGAGHDGYLGGKYWHNPGAFRGEKAIDHFKGVSSVFVTSAFAFGGSEFVALSASEQANPRKSIPSAAKLILYRIIWVYLTSITILGFLVPWDSPQLQPSSDGKKTSPYVVAIAMHGVKVVPHLINAVILMAVLSVSNSAFFYSSRLLLSLSQRGYAPKWFDYVDRKGRPVRAMLISALFGVICFCATSKKETDVFSWLLAISGLSTIFTYFSICVSHIRMRSAMKVQGRSLGELGFRSQVGTYGSFYACLLLVLSLMAEFWVALAPIGEGKLDAESFFENYLAAPIGIVFYFGYMIWKKDFRIFIRSKDIDLDFKRQVFDEDLIKQEDEEYAEQMRNAPRWRKVIAFLF